LLPRLFVIGLLLVFVNVPNSLQQEQAGL